MVALARDMIGDHLARPVLVVANDADAGGLERAAEMGIETAVVDHRPFKGDRAAFEAALQARILQAKPDILCLAGFMRILTAGFTDQWAGRMLNIHPSLLPKYRGLHTHARAIEAGDATHGCSVHHVTAGMDEGPVICQAEVPIAPGDTADTLAAKVLKEEHRIYPLALAEVAQAIG